MNRARSILFLQGMACRFFAQLGAELRARGHAVHRVNFNAGDRLFWPLRGAVDFRGRAEEWPDFLRRLIAARAVTDLVLFGDCRPLHRPAVALARALRIPVHVCEEGYIRPGWITFEQGGVNGHSKLPRDPDWYRSEADRLPPLAPAQPIPGSFRRRAAEDLAYNLVAVAFGFAYPHHRTHRPRHRLLEYADWSWKVIRFPQRRRRSQAELARLSADASYFVLPLQLESDFQIRVHSGFAGMLPAIAAVISSFARHAPSGALLVVKEHPLDDGGIDWRSATRVAAAAEGVAERVVHVEVGDVERLIDRARGVVTVNSTTGPLALARGVPVSVLGRAIYDIEGLTFRGPLDAFWRGAPPPDAALFAAFRRVLAERCLLPGNLFSALGLRSLVAHAAARIEAAPAA